MPDSNISSQQMRLLDAAVADAEATGITFIHSVMAQTCLPYSDPGEEHRWYRENGNVKLIVTTAELLNTDTNTLYMPGLPYGPKARLMMAHINTLAMKKGSPKVDTGGTITGFVKNRLKMAPHGRNIRTIKEQATRLASCRMRFIISESGKAKYVETGIASEFTLWMEGEGEDRVNWPTELVLSPHYYASLEKHAIPLNPDHLQALSDTALGLDLYAWFGQRLHRIKVGVPEKITWPSITDQFGLTYDRPRKFRESFLDAMRKVTTVYRDARIELNPEGLSLYHSNPPIPPKIKKPRTNGGASV